MIEKTHLLIVSEVERMGTLTQAASQLNLTQSALTHSIKKLEQRLGVLVWEKHGRNLKLTPAGAEILDLARRVLPQLEHTQRLIQQHAKGGRGLLRIGMECHPCYRWLLGKTKPYLDAWPDVELDVKQQFSFGGLGALINHEIDLLITPDPLQQKGLNYVPVFDYEQVLVVSQHSTLAKHSCVEAQHLANQTLITYPVERSRLDVYQFLAPSHVEPKRHRTLETTEIMLQLIGANQGVGALPDWLVAQEAERYGLKAVRLGNGVFKQIHLGFRSKDLDNRHLSAFVELAQTVS